MAQQPQLKGFAAIDKVITAEPEPIYQADGYQVRVTAATDKTFRDKLNTLADITPGAWIRFSGKRDSSGVIVAEKASFYPLKSGTKPPNPLQLQTGAPNQESLIDSEGRFVPAHTKVRLSDAEGLCGWHRVTVNREEQERVRRIGLRLIPAYQKQMADDSVAKIHFRFFVIEHPGVRAELACSPGLVLMPRQALERLENDDQLAAVLADGIGYSLQASRAKVLANLNWITAAEWAGDASWFANPFAAFAVTETVVKVASYEINIQQAQERGRLALTMMADAGYDPWQAPEAWKLLHPRHLPADRNSLTYPNLGEHQLKILKAQYSKRSDKVASAANAE
jgi:hypothetical protein